MKYFIVVSIILLSVHPFLSMNAQKSKTSQKEYHVTQNGNTIITSDPSNNLILDSAFKDPRYQAANTAKDADYLSDEEKKVYFCLNLARMNPKLFAETYLGRLRNSKNSYESSLYKEMMNLSALPLLTPNRKLYESALCHADEMGVRGLIGHQRYKCTRYFMGECCQYGFEGAYDIVIDLLVDDGITSLGHRKICFSASYHELGVSIRPHKTYRVNTVMDFM